MKITNTKLFVVLMLSSGLFFTTNEVLAQQTTVSPTPTTVTPAQSAQVQEQIQQTAKETVSTQTFPVDITLLTSIAGSVGGLLYKDKRDKDALTAQLKEAVDVMMVLNASYIKFFNASMLYPEKNNKQILQLKAANNALEDSTLADEMANGITRYQKFAAGNFHLPMPNMQTPTPQVINATTLIAENKVAEALNTPTHLTSSSSNTTSTTPPSSTGTNNSNQ